MRTITISILNSFRYSGIACFLIFLIGSFSGCNNSSNATYHEMTAADLEQMQKERQQDRLIDTTAESASPDKTTSEEKKKEEVGASATKEENSEAPLPSMDNKGDKTEEKETSEASQPKNLAGSKVGPDEKKMASATKAGKPGAPQTKPMLPGEKAEKRTPKLLIPEKTFSKEADGELRVSFDDIDLLKVLNMEPVPEDALEMFPEWLSGLEGKRVRIRGFMFPTLSQTGITYFQHVRDNEICCFGRTPKVYDRISTTLREGTSTKYIQGRPFDVIGTLKMDPIYIDGEWLQLYMLEDAVVVDK